MRKRYIDANSLSQRIIGLNRDIDYGIKYFNSVYNLIMNEPTVDVVEVVHGEWINTGSTQICSVCKEEQYGFDTGRYYCPNCGAKMDGGVR